MDDNYYCDAAYELFKERRDFEHKMLKRMAILLTHYKVQVNPTREEFKKFCGDNLNMSVSNGYRLIQELREGTL